MEIIESADNRIIQEDMEQIAAEFASENRLNGTTVLVTGSTGLIGSQVVKALACINRKSRKNMKIIAYARNEEKVKKVFKTLLERGDVSYEIGDINESLTITEPVDYIIHGASATSSKFFVTNPVETIQTAINGTFNVLEFAKRQETLKCMVYLSSLEVYGVPARDGSLIKEEDYGYIDILNVRSSYSEGKKMVECICASYAEEYQLPVKIARLSQTFGPGVEYSDGRVFAEFARCALEKKDIVLHTQGRTVRSYCYTKDAVRALFYIMMDGISGEAYNVTNMDTLISIRDMAELVAKTIGEGQISVIIDAVEDVSSFGYNPEMVIKLDNSKLRGLGWEATVNLEKMYQNMVEGFAKIE